MKSSSVQRSTSTPSCVFVVDDDAALRAMLVVTLTKAGFAARAFASADEFIAAFDPRVSGCLLLDFNMPGTSGLELQRLLAARGVHLPIVFLTGKADVPKAVDAMRAGAIDILQKPFDRAVLIERIGAALALERRLRETEGSVAANRNKIALLTKRELQICELLVDGLASKEIARKLTISTRTVEHHRANVLRKIEASNVVELARIFLAARKTGPPSTERGT